jgi:uncharacterized protein YqeY
MLEKINADIKTAMKAKEKERLEALRYLKSMLMENNTSKSPKEPMDVVISHVKKLNDSLKNFPEDNPLHAKTKQEIEFLKVYMPEQLDVAAVQKLIDDIKAKHDNPHMGVIMKELTPQIKGKFDGRKASEMVKSALK